jgi:ABC-type bacteriocin/lantibiotic exporter with double-glycine peptidase domain
LLFWGAARCLSGALEIGALVASLQSCMALWGAVSQLARVPIALVSLQTLSARADLLRAESTPPPSSPPPADGREDAIRVNGLWFRYGADAPWLFHGYDLRVARGEVVRLRWPSGQGKSTLLRMLAGLYRPAHGSVTIFGVDAEQARERVCYLPQTSVLFPGSILENLRRLSGGASVDRIFHAAAITGLDQVVKAWAMGFETCVIAGGSNISSGQKQLVALTAAIASERPLLLLDESTAHLDPLTRARLAAAGAFEGRTVVTVVHDHEPGEGAED